MCWVWCQVQYATPDTWEANLGAPEQAEWIYIYSDATKLKVDEGLSYQNLFNVLTSFRLVLHGQNLHPNLVKDVAVTSRNVFLRAIML